MNICRTKIYKAKKSVNKRYKNEISKLKFNSYLVDFLNDMNISLQ